MYTPVGTIVQLIPRSAFPANTGQCVGWSSYIAMHTAQRTCMLSRNVFRKSLRDLGGSWKSVAGLPRAFRACSKGFNPENQFIRCISSATRISLITPAICGRALSSMYKNWTDFTPNNQTYFCRMALTTPIEHLE